MWTCLAQSLDSEFKSQHRLSDSLILEMPQTSPSDMATRSLPPYFTHIVKVKFAHSHLLTILTKDACHHNSFWGSRCHSNHASTISLKPVHFHRDLGNSIRLTTQFLSRHTSSLTSDHPHYLELIRPYFLLNLYISANPYQNKPFQACNSEHSKNKPKHPDAFTTTSTKIDKEPSFIVKPTKIQSVFGARGLMS